MIEVVKRDGSLQNFDKQKIINAIKKANDDTIKECKIYEPDIEEIANDVCNALTIEAQYMPIGSNLVINIETIQDEVELALQVEGFYTVAKNYIKYRYNRELARSFNKELENRYNQVTSLISGQNEEANKENSNKDTRIIPTMRDYLAGFTCREMGEKFVLPKDIIEAHREGLIHYHDMDYSPVMPMTNCFKRSTTFVTNKGIKSFEDYKDGDVITVLTPSGNWESAIVRNYGKQFLNRIILKKGNSREQEIFATGNHRWLLSDGSETISLKIGDKLKNHMMPCEHTISKLLSLPLQESIYWCKGFVFGDGSKWGKNGSRIRLCGEKTKYSQIFEEQGFHISSVFDNGDMVYACADCAKEGIQDNWSPQEIALFIEGWLAADGSYRNNVKEAKSIITIGKSKDIDMFKQYSCVGNYHIISEDVLTGEETNYGVRKATSTFRLSASNHFKWKVVSIEKNVLEEDVWCLEVGNEHSFVLEHGIVTGNCCLINLDDMLQNGTVISGTMIEKPHSFRTACTIATQIIAQVASSQYGGNTISLAHLAPFVDVSRQSYKSKYPSMSDEDIEKIVKHEVKDGVQTIQYQLITISTTNGQAPFTSVFAYLDEVPSGQTREDLAMIIEEVLRQRMEGVKNEQGVRVTTAFPKILYCLDEDNIYEDSKYWYLTKLAAECTSKRLVPDYISAKKMRELKEGNVFPSMGCRSFLAPYYDKDGKPKFYGRFNQGVVTLNLPDIALSSGGDFDEFWKIFDERLDLCYRALMTRHNSLKGTKSDVAPILWQHGAYARLKSGETIDKLLYNDYSSISLGYAGLYECVKYMTGESQTESKGHDFGIKVMQHLSDACTKWKNETNIGFSLYGSPIESTTYKFAKCLQKRFGIIEGITDKKYVTNSYHITPSQEIDAFSKLSIESDFSKYSAGGQISYVEVPNMEKNVDALLEVIKHIYETNMYAEINSMTSYCQVCGCRDIKMGDDLKFHCPQCGNDDFNKMNIALRICGYISTNPFNEGRANDIHDRVYHLGMD